MANNYRILVVDDVLDNLFLLQAVLEDEGYSVDTALDGTIALHKIQYAPPDLVLLDIMMPGLTGYDVTRQVRQQKPATELPIVLLTAYDEFSHLPYSEIGANDLIRKPVDFDELLTTVETHLRSPVTAHT
ncbi:response regulator [Myxacorys almedinensis]|uniref:Response regulator n=1 Tax=Myxacorys almedinensis A TaxID=2690445 RepID=A0A8J8CKG1_9CYAN|nr:response regulator [Myxacorys almedinensis]NDJ16610.1 response regulator [Myxacorys almedinensis A]